MNNKIWNFIFCVSFTVLAIQQFYRSIKYNDDFQVVFLCVLVSILNFQIFKLKEKMENE